MKRLIGILTVLLYLSILLAVISGCEKAKQAQAEAKRQEEISAGSIEPLHLGNGVYRFECTGARWENSLVKFKGEHPELIITTISHIPKGGFPNIITLVVTEKR